jgi:RNA polymerase sigma factor (sigma-70 family)
VNRVLDPARRDLALLERWRRGDREAGASLLGYYKDGFHRLCIRFGVRDQDEQVELFQDVVLATLRELPVLPEKIVKSFSGWFSWQVRNAISRRRRAARAANELPDELTESAASPDSRAALREAIKRCWDRLPAMEHQVFELRFIKGLSLKEAAEVIETSANAVGQSVFRLSRKMRDCLGASGFDHGRTESAR